MKQVLIRKGSVVIAEVPAPLCSDHTILVKVFYSCISTGTEIAGIDASGKSLLNQVVEQPKKLVKAFHSIKDEGVKVTVKKIQSVVDSSRVSLLGYSASGVVVQAGKNIKDIHVGDKVACALRPQSLYGN
jgi:threonine dehydrogenase-like Zn-dependent dehydrogenase